MQKFLFYSASLVMIFPMSVLAETVRPATDFKSFVGSITDIIGMLVMVIFALTFLVFMWGVIKGWVLQGGSEEGVASGKEIVFAGIVAFVVMSSIWGILYLLKGSLFGG